MAQILVVDDEIGIRELLSEILRDEGHDVRLAENAAAARAARDKARPDLVLLDIWMPDSDGVTLLKEWAANGQLTMPVVMMSGHATIDTAVEATRIGALDFLEKPIALARLLAAVKRALEKVSPPPGASVSLSLAAFNRSGPLRDLKRQLEQVTAKSRSVLLRSKPGGIVELMARTLQMAGKGWLDLSHDPNPLTLETLQSTFGGVLYVEELARLTRLQQRNLQFALERLEKFSLHLITATQYDLMDLHAQGWDEAILRRLSAVALGAPALAHLADEIPDIAAHLLMQQAESGEAPLRRLSTAAQNALRQYAWPGGYGELRSTLRSLALAALEETIDAGDVARLLNPSTHANGMAPAGLAAQVLELPLREAREIFERAYFEFHLRDANGNMSRVAEKSGLERTHLYRKLKDLGLR
jgi:DNA-binding NtrC family response regulator